MTLRVRVRARVERLERIILPFKMHDKFMKRIPPPSSVPFAAARRSVNKTQRPVEYGPTCTKKGRVEGSPLLNIGNFSFGVGDVDRTPGRRHHRDSFRGRGMTSSPFFSLQPIEASSTYSNNALKTASLHPLAPTHESVDENANE